jgi:hypothetical protein
MVEVAAETDWPRMKRAVRAKLSAVTRFSILSRLILFSSLVLNQINFLAFLGGVAFGSSLMISEHLNQPFIDPKIYTKKS